MATAPYSAANTQTASQHQLSEVVEGQNVMQYYIFCSILLKIEKVCFSKSALSHPNSCLNPAIKEIACKKQNKKQDFSLYTKQFRLKPQLPRKIVSGVPLHTPSICRKGINTISEAKSNCFHQSLE